MLRRLYIKNLAIIQELEVTFSAGLNVITGETGSGKSILIDAIGLLLGGRATADMIRSGEGAAIVEGELVHGEDRLVIRRLMRANGNSRTFLNDEPVKLADLEEKAGALVDLHGQHEHQSLLRVGTHVDFLDAYAGLLPEREVLAHTFNHLHRLAAKVEDLRNRIATQRELHELHSFQLQELEAASPSVAEERQLTEEHKLLSQAEELNALLVMLDARLQQNEPSLTGELSALQRQLERFAQLSPELSQLSDRLQSAKLELDDLAFDAARYGEKVHPAPARLAEIEERLRQLESMKRKYGGSMEAVQAKMKELRELVKGYASADDQLARLEDEQENLANAYAAQCQSLSRERQAASGRLAEDIIVVLARLDMPATRFEVRITHAPAELGLCVIDGQGYKSDDSGYDLVEFYISPNPGEELRPLARTASGGEISRTMLGIKTVLAAFDPVSCLIFDEIDSGISGSTAETVGITLEELARSRQVICITHLPQIAARGDHHLRVQKVVSGGRTLSRVAVVEGEKRQSEVARLLSGSEITRASMDQANALLAKIAPRQEMDLHG